MKNEGKGLLDLTNTELKQSYRNSVKGVDFSSNNYYKEIIRRYQERHTKAIIFLTVVATASTVIAAISTVRSFF